MYMVIEFDLTLKYISDSFKYLRKKDDGEN